MFCTFFAQESKTSIFYKNWKKIICPIRRTTENFVLLNAALLDGSHCTSVFYLNFLLQIYLFPKCIIFVIFPQFYFFFLGKQFPGTFCKIPIFNNILLINMFIKNYHHSVSFLRLPGKNLLLQFTFFFCKNHTN